MARVQQLKSRCFLSIACSNEESWKLIPFNLMRFRGDESCCARQSGHRQGSQMPDPRVNLIKHQELQR